VVARVGAGAALIGVGRGVGLVVGVGLGVDLGAAEVRASAAATVERTVDGAVVLGAAGVLRGVGVALVGVAVTRAPAGVCSDTVGGSWAGMRVLAALVGWGRSVVTSAARFSAPARLMPTTSTAHPATQAAAVTAPVTRPTPM
jgi:hypothetical protein